MSLRELIRRAYEKAGVPLPVFSVEPGRVFAAPSTPPEPPFSFTVRVRPR